MPAILPPTTAVTFTASYEVDRTFRVECDTYHENRQWSQISVVHLEFPPNRYKSMVGGLSRRGASPSERVCRAISDIVATHT
jgi:hypothetical protein